MRIKTLMRNLGGVVDVRESLLSATMRLARDPGTCLIAKDGARLVGVLTESDVRAAGPSTVPALAVHELPMLTSRLTVADAVRGDPVVVAPDAAVPDVARELRTRRHRAAVVADGTEVLGVVTTADLLGALIERLEREAPGSLTRLLVAVRLPPAARGGRGMCTALGVAVDIAKRHGATLTVLHVMRRLSPRVAAGLPAGVDADVHRWRLAEARAALTRLVPADTGSLFRVEVRAGDVVQGVLDGAAATGAEFIVMGGRPTSSIVRETMRRAPCPVLAV